MQTTTTQSTEQAATTTYPSWLNTPTSTKQSTEQASTPKSTTEQAATPTPWDMQTTSPTSTEESFPLADRNRCSALVNSKLQFVLPKV